MPRQHSADEMPPMQAERESDPLNQALDRARTEARSLLESAIAAHARAEAIDEALQREIHQRKQVEAALRATEQRYRWMLDAIGNLQGLSAADRESLRLDDPSPSLPATGSP